MGLEIKSLTTDLYSQYNDFLLRYEGALLYYSVKYKEFLKDLLKCEEDYLLAVEGDNIVGILPLMYIEGKFGKVYNSLPFYGPNGGIIASKVEAVEALIK